MNKDQERTLLVGGVLAILMTLTFAAPVDAQNLENGKVVYDKWLSLKLSKMYLSP